MDSTRWIELCEARGDVAVKPEFIKNLESYQPWIQLTGAKVEPPSKRHKAATGQNRNRQANIRHIKEAQASQICSGLARTGECSKENCPYSHDLKERRRLLGSAPAEVPFLGPRCPNFVERGVCREGVNCIFGLSHTDEDGFNITQAGRRVTPLDLEALRKEQINNIEQEITQRLRKNKYDWSLAKGVVTTVNSFVDSRGSDEPTPPKTLSLANKLVLAPLTTVGNLPFRRLCVGFGADVTVSEMILAKALTRGSLSDMSLLKRHPCEKVFGVQLAGGNAEEFAKATQFLKENATMDFIDINAGCPLDALNRTGAGAALLTRPARLERVVRSVVSISPVPVTIKMRNGFDDLKVSFGEEGCQYVAKSLQARLCSWGVSAIFHHGRTAKQRYTRQCDWPYLHHCALTIPSSVDYVANGDLLNLHEYEREKDEAIQGHMIGRGALIKPWIFQELKQGKVWDISATERFDVLKDYCKFGLDHWGYDKKGIQTTRRFLLEWLSFANRYVPVGILETHEAGPINKRPPPICGRSELEELMASPCSNDWVKLSERLLGRVEDGFTFLPKHKSHGCPTEESL
ncbi:MAG: hypothetical protein KVP17_000622 [Porospora cf. gigantea B]|uniref:uncharacterized protein n=1 Tax=Porospora cf. gigantea B TaxID=2853592 RepID=UPI003571B717|nr:MAG: hypothetical protein KVP17_000622 [Porospora cf. gigantea B]